MPEETAAPSDAEVTDDRSTWLTVQTILYGNDPEMLIRSGESLARSIELAVKERLVTRCWWHIGDCSPSAVLRRSHIERLEAMFTPIWGHISVDLFGKNLGHGGGHNALFERLDTPVVLIANPDLIFAPDTISALMRRMTTRVGLIDARQIPLEHPKAYEEKTGETSWASGACVLARTQMLREIGGFDSTSFFLYCDDVDLSWRARLAGYHVVSEPAARVFHDKRLGEDGTIVVSDAERYYSAEAGLLLAHKYSNPGLVEEIREALAASRDPDHQRAVAEYDRRKSDGQLPDPIDTEHSVAQFLDGAYAVHRF